MEKSLSLSSHILSSFEISLASWVVTEGKSIKFFSCEFLVLESSVRFSLNERPNSLFKVLPITLFFTVVLEIPTFRFGSEDLVVDVNVTFACVAVRSWLKLSVGLSTTEILSFEVSELGTDEEDIGMPSFQAEILSSKWVSLAVAGRVATLVERRSIDLSSSDFNEKLTIVVLGSVSCDIAADCIPSWIGKPASSGMFSSRSFLDIFSADAESGDSSTSDIFWSSSRSSGIPTASWTFSANSISSTTSAIPMSSSPISKCSISASTFSENPTLSLTTSESLISSTSEISMSPSSSLGILMLFSTSSEVPLLLSPRRSSFCSSIPSSFCNTDTQMLWSTLHLLVSHNNTSSLTSLTKNVSFSRTDVLWVNWFLSSNDDFSSMLSFSSIIASSLLIPDSRIEGLFGIWPLSLLILVVKILSLLLMREVVVVWSLLFAMMVGELELLLSLLLTVMYMSLSLLVVIEVAMLLVVWLLSELVMLERFLMTFFLLSVEAMFSVLSSLLEMLVIALLLSLSLIIVEAILVDFSSSIDMLWLLGLVVVVVVVAALLSTPASSLTTALLEALSLTTSFFILEGEAAEWPSSSMFELWLAASAIWTPSSAKTSGSLSLNLSDP